MERDTGHRPRDRTAKDGLPEQGGVTLDGQSAELGNNGVTADGQEIRSENIGDGSRLDFQRRTLESRRSMRGDTGRIGEPRGGETRGDGRESTNVRDAINRRRGRELSRDVAGREQAKAGGEATRADVRSPDVQARSQSDSIINNNVAVNGGGVNAESPLERSAPTSRFMPQSRFARPVTERGEGALPRPRRDTSHTARFEERSMERRGITDSARFAEHSAERRSVADGAATSAPPSAHITPIVPTRTTAPDPLIAPPTQGAPQIGEQAQAEPSPSDLGAYSHTRPSALREGRSSIPLRERAGRLHFEGGGKRGGDVSGAGSSRKPAYRDGLRDGAVFIDTNTETRTAATGATIEPSAPTHAEPIAALSPVVSPESVVPPVVAPESSAADASKAAPVSPADTAAHTSPSSERVPDTRRTTEHKTGRKTAPPTKPHSEAKKLSKLKFGKDEAKMSTSKPADTKSRDGKTRDFDIYAFASINVSPADENGEGSL